MHGVQQHKEKTPSTIENNDNLSNDDDSNTLQEPNKPEIKFTPDMKRRDQYFLGLFKDLAKDNNGLVHYDELQEGLISTGKFDAGEAVLMIEHMEKTGEIEQTEQYHMYRR